LGRGETELGAQRHKGRQVWERKPTRKKHEYSTETGCGLQKSHRFDRKKKRGGGGRHVEISRQDEEDDETQGHSVGACGHVSRLASRDFNINRGWGQ